MEDRFDTLIERSRTLKTEVRMLQQNVSNMETELLNLRDDVQVLLKVEELFKYLLDKYVHRYTESFSEIVTEGVKTIFPDQDIAFEARVEQKRGKVWVEFDTIHNGMRGQSLQSFGGGVASVQSFLLRLLVLLKKDLAKYLILDESLAALADYYVPYCGEFIQKMCRELGVHVLLITHNRTFLDYSDRTYEAELVNGELVLKRSL